MLWRVITLKYYINVKIKFVRLEHEMHIDIYY